MQITKDILESYVKEDWLISQRHPTLPLTIYNYSQTTQYEQHWDEVTLQCRGLVFDDEGNIVSHPFRKFFNIEENRHEPTEDFEIYEKVDGSLITVFNYNGEWIVSSRGSFTSEQAIAAAKLFNQLNYVSKIHSGINPNMTYLFELIAPWNRIVCDYGEREELILLGARGENFEASHDELSELAKMLGCNVTRKFNFEDYKEIQKLNWENQEGFIVRFSNGDRCKIKFADYVKLHRVLTNCSSYDIWENLMTFNKLPEEFLNDVPDEFYQWVKGVESALRKAYEFQLHLHMATVSTILRYGGLDRKTIAERVMATTGVNRGVLFGLIDGKDVTEKLWKLVKPAYQKPFSETKLVEAV